MPWTCIIFDLTPRKATWILSITIRNRYSTALFRVGMSFKGRNFLFFPLFPFPPPTKKLSVYIKMGNLLNIYDVGRMLVLIKSQHQEAQICKETLSKTSMVCASSLGFVHKCFAGTNWLEYGSPFCSWMCKPNLGHIEKKDHKETIPAPSDTQDFHVLREMRENISAR